MHAFGFRNNLRRFLDRAGIVLVVDGVVVIVFGLGVVVVVLSILGILSRFAPSCKARKKIKLVV